VSVIALMDHWNVGKLLVVDTGNENLHRSVRNLKNAKYLEAEGLNVRDLLKYGNVVLTSAALLKIQERFAS